MKHFHNSLAPQKVSFSHKHMVFIFLRDFPQISHSSFHVTHVHVLELTKLSCFQGLTFYKNEILPFVKCNDATYEMKGRQNFKVIDFCPSKSVS